MTSPKDLKRDGREFSPRPPISEQDKELIVDYLQAGLKMGKPRDHLLEELAEKYQRSPRQIERYIAHFSPPKANLTYEETPHKQKMRELAGEVATEIYLPFEFASFIEERIPGDWFIGDGFLININKSGKVRPVMEVEFKYHLYDALLSHLETGGFKEVTEKITDWKRESGEILVASHKLLRMIMQDLGKRSNLLFSFDSLEQAGFTLDFFKILHRGAIMGRNKATPYRLRGCSLWCGVYQIYNGSLDEDLETYRDTHIELMDKYHKTDLAKQIGKQVRKLWENEGIIRSNLRKFGDMERVPGQCDLCSK